MFKKFFIFLLTCLALQLPSDAFWTGRASRMRLRSMGTKLPNAPVKRTVDNKAEEIARSSFAQKEAKDGFAQQPNSSAPRWKNPYAVFGFGLLSAFGYYQTSWQLEKMRKEGREAHAIRQEEFKQRAAGTKPLINWSDFPDEKPGSKK